MKEGTNRTGVFIAPQQAKELIENVNRFSPPSNLDDSGAALIRARYIKDGMPIGSRPPKDTNGFMDKVGARLAFERSGVRLYNALLQKRAAMPAKSAPTKADLEHIRAEEYAHMLMLEKIIMEAGGDPTMMTPSADIEGTMTTGVMQVVLDPRTTVAQCLDAMLTAELVDNDGWTVLIEMARDAGKDEITAQFEKALSEEQEHLQNVRSWIRRELAA
jgi:rubrerythrin